MRLRFLLPALLIGAGLMLPVQTPAQAKTSYKAKKFKGKKFKGAKKFKGSKRYSSHKVPKHKTAQHR